MAQEDNKAAPAPIEFSEECAMLQASAGDFLVAHSDIAQVRQRLQTASGFDAALWQRMADLGWCGVAVPQSHGGAGLGASALTALLEPMGRFLFGTPFVATTLAGQLLLAQGDEAQQARWLPEVASGKTVATCALLDLDGSWALQQPRATAAKEADGYVLQGTKHQVLDAASAELLLLSALLDGTPAVFIVERAQLPEGALRRHTLMDETRRAHALQLDALHLPADALLGGPAAPDATSALTRLQRLGTLLMAAEMTGGCLGVMELTLEYLKTRKQFGKLIGGYQSLKHPMVDIMTGHDMARSLCHVAATAFDRDPLGERTATALHTAKAQAGRVFTYAADRSIQFHGAIGFTYECHAQLYYRRAQWSEYAFGDTLHHRRQLGEQLLRSA